MSAETAATISALALWVGILVLVLCRIRGGATMQLRCAWCGCIIRYGTEPASHGVCEPCSVRIVKEMP